MAVNVTRFWTCSTYKRAGQAPEHVIQWPMTEKLNELGFLSWPEFKERALKSLEKTQVVDRENLDWEVLDYLRAEYVAYLEDLCQ